MRDSIDQVCRHVYCLHGAGSFMAASVIKSLLKMGLIAWKAPGPAAKGTEAGVRKLRGEVISPTQCHGVWPWSADSRKLRDAAGTRAKHFNMHYMDIHHSLCEWQELA